MFFKQLALDYSLKNSFFGIVDDYSQLCDQGGNHSEIYKKYNFQGHKFELIDLLFESIVEIKQLPASFIYKLFLYRVNNLHQEFDSFEELIKASSKGKFHLMALFAYIKDRNVDDLCDVDINYKNAHYDHDNVELFKYFLLNSKCMELLDHYFFYLKIKHKDSLIKGGLLTSIVCDFSQLVNTVNQSILKLHQNMLTPDIRNEGGELMLSKFIQVLNSGNNQHQLTLFKSLLHLENRILINIDDLKKNEPVKRAKDSHYEVSDKSGSMFIDKYFLYKQLLSCLNLDEPLFKRATRSILNIYFDEINIADKKVFLHIIFDSKPDGDNSNLLIHQSFPDFFNINKNCSFLNVMLFSSVYDSLKQPVDLVHVINDFFKKKFIDSGLSKSKIKVSEERFTMSEITRRFDYPHEFYNSLNFNNLFIFLYHIENIKRFLDSLSLSQYKDEKFKESVVNKIDKHHKTLQDIIYSKACGKIQHCFRQYLKRKSQTTLIVSNKKTKKKKNKKKKTKNCQHNFSQKQHKAASIIYSTLNRYVNQKKDIAARHITKHVFDVAFNNLSSKICDLNKRNLVFKQFTEQFRIEQLKFVLNQRIDAFLHGDDSVLFGNLKKFYYEQLDSHRRYDENNFGYLQANSKQLCQESVVKKLIAHQAIKIKQAETFLSRYSNKMTQHLQSNTHFDTDCFLKYSPSQRLHNLLCRYDDVCIDYERLSDQVRLFKLWDTHFLKKRAFGLLKVCVG